MVYGLLGALLAAYLAWLIIRTGQAYSSLVDGWIVDTIELLASGLCLARAFYRRSGRRFALFLGLGLLAWTFGDVVTTIESLGGTSPSSPSLADAFYLAFFPLAYVAVFLFVRGETRRLATPSWLDGAVAGLGAGAACAAFVFHTIARSAGGGALAVVIDLSYPVGDLLLLGLVIGGAALLSGRRKGPWLLLASGCGLNAAGDASNLFGSSFGGTHVGGVMIGIAWPVAILMMSMAVWMRPGAVNPIAPPKPTGFLLPGLAAAAALIILLVGTIGRVDPVAVGLATATLLAVGLRLTVSMRGLRTLTQERHRLSVTDHLTGLSNRRYLFDMLNAYFADEAAEAAPERRLALLFIDLNHFKEVNDSFGHPAGDQVLRQLCERLAGSLQPTDVLSRFGGDEFAVVLMDADADAAMRTAKQLSASLEEPFVLDAMRASIGASIGIALAPSDATDSDGLVRCADVAMYRAKLGGSPFALYEQNLEGEDKLRLAEELRAAIAGRQFVLHYQPQLDLRTGEILAVEALIRWAHPRLGLLPPLQFLPMAEEAGLMGMLTPCVLTQALRQCARWRAAGRRMTVSVNVSATNLLDDGFTDVVRDLLLRHEVPAEALVLEITETCIIKEFERSKRVIAELCDLGLVVSIDDFGAGATSLAYLSSLEIGELKLDRAFITDLVGPRRKRDVELVRGTIELGHSLGLRVVAEGIEDEPTLDLLADLGCDLAQGYFINTPQPAHRISLLPDEDSSSAERVAPAHSAPYRVGSRAPAAIPRRDRAGPLPRSPAVSGIEPAVPVASAALTAAASGNPGGGHDVSLEAYAGQANPVATSH